MKHLTDISKILGSTMGIIVALWFFGEPFLEDYVDERAEKIIIKKVTSVEFLTSIMDSPFMLDYKKHEKEEVIKEALHQGDSTKVKLSANLVAKTGMNKQAMADTLASIISSWVDSKGFVNNDKCVKNSKKYGRGRNAASF